MIRPHTRPSHPSHRRDRSSRFGDGFYMEKYRASYICYLSKTYSVRNFFQNSIGNSSTSTTCNTICIAGMILQLESQWNSISNSSTSTTCNSIYIAGTILQLQSTMEFCRPHIHETQVKPHFQCGTDPTMTRIWSEHDPTTHDIVSHPSHRKVGLSRFGNRLCMQNYRVSCICYLLKSHSLRDFLEKFYLKILFTIDSFPHWLFLCLTLSLINSFPN